MNFPRYVFCNHGPHQRAGGTYDSKIVSSSDEFNQAIEDGWSNSIPEAVAVVHVEELVNLSEPNQNEKEDETKPPTREELETKARELGIKFDGRIGDKKLTALIEKALEA